jgi:glutathionylspermidine synthase
MQRISVSPRANLDARARETDFTFATIDGALYWDERAYYAFTLDEIERDLEAPTGELAALCLELVARVADDERLLTRLGIPKHAWGLIRDSWRKAEPSLYGRFDFAYDGTGPAKMLEYNADTPTSLFEASVFQWLWLEDAMAQGLIQAQSDQFNSLHEALVDRLRHVRAKAGGPAWLHLTCAFASEEDRGFISYLATCAAQAGFKTKCLDIGAIGTSGSGPFVDAAFMPISLLFKLYPWEWMLADTFSHSPSMAKTRFVEPPWKAILSNKGILPLLWEMVPGHPNLLESYFEDDPACDSLGERYARKPLHSREGSNVVLIEDGRVADQASGPYGGGVHIRQALARLPCFAGNYPVIGSWVVGEAACGIGIREDVSPITKNTSRFVPHAILS